MGGAAIVLLLPLRSHALFGVGDIVYDPANVAQTVSLVQETGQQLSRLGSLLGVSTQQLTQLLQLAQSLGNGSEAAGFGQAPTAAQLQASLQSIPGLEQATLGSLLRSDGQLDAFLGLPVSAWVGAVQHPDQLFRAALLLGAAERTGLNETALDSTAYAQWLAQQTPEDQANRGARSVADVSSLLSTGWLDQAQTRRTNLQALAGGTQAAETASGAARTVADQENAHAQLTVQTNRILLEAAVQAGGAQEAFVRSAAAQTQLLESAAEERRDAAELRLDGGY
jgi:hypothetical protein